MKRMAFDKPLASQNYSLAQSILFYGLLCVGRATWIETAAISKKGRNEELVNFYQNQKNFFHRD